MPLLKVSLAKGSLPPFRKGSTPIWTIFIFEPAHDKTYNRLVRPAKTRIRLRIRAVWSESSLIACAFYNLRAIQNGMNENPCHTVWMYRLICLSHRSNCTFCRARAQFLKKTHFHKGSKIHFDRVASSPLKMYLFFLSSFLHNKT